MAHTYERPRMNTFMLGTGVLLVLIGFCFLLVPLFATMLAGIAAGALLLVSGVAQVADSIGHRNRGWGWALAAGLLAAVAGLLLLADPVAGMIGLTVLLASYLLVSGVFRMVLAASWRPTPGWGWALVNGIFSVALGLLVLSGWPGTGLWAVGLFLGVDTLLAGFGRIAYAIGEAPVPERFPPGERR